MNELSATPEDNAGRRRRTRAVVVVVIIVACGAWWTFRPSLLMRRAAGVHIGQSRLEVIHILGPPTAGGGPPGSGAMAMTTTAVWDDPGRRQFATAINRILDAASVRVKRLEWGVTIEFNAEDRVEAINRQGAIEKNWSQ
jgi:hypothetical protein